MNLNELSQKLEDHLTDQEIQDAQELLDNTYQEIVDMRGELVEAQAEIDALKLQRDELLAQQWRPIESAPRDGTRILLLCPMVGVVCGAWSIEQFAAKPRPYFTTDRERGIGITATRNDQPTHWQPLPIAPIAKAWGES